MYTQLNGYSGFELIKRKNSKGYSFQKKSKNNAKRLLKQCKKQEQYIDILSNSKLSYAFSVPKVIAKTHNSFTMEYVYGKSIIDVIETGNYQKLSYIIDALFQLIEWETSLCTYEKLQQYSSNFLTKLTTIPNNISLKSKIRQNLSELEHHQIPIGFCHGDLTLSNLIVSDKLVLIDLLDPFIESPLQDICKLLQEVDLMWALQMHPNIKDTAKVTIAYEFLKDLVYEKTEKYCKVHNINRKILFMFHLMTLVRLLAYTKTKDMELQVKKKCVELIKNEKNFSSSYCWRK